MKMCADHWATCRKAIKDRGLDGLVARDGRQVMDDAVADLSGEPDLDNSRFDPLMSMNWHWSGVALKAGGLSMMAEGPASNDGHFCPLCEMASHYPDFDPEDEVSKVADQMLAWAREQSLVPRAA